MTESDLYEASNYFAVGHYQGAINEASSFNNSQLTPENRILKEIYIQRSHLAKGNFDYVLQQYVENPPSTTDFEAIVLFCKYLNPKTDSRSQVLQTIQDFSSTPATENLTFQTVSSQIFYLENELEKSLQIASFQSTHKKTFLHLELLSIKVQIFLKIGRVDHAEKTVRIMHSIDEDHAFTQLCMAWTYLSMNNPEKIGEAKSIYEDLIRRYGKTPVLQNGLGACLMNEKKWEDAEKCFLTVLETRWEDENALVNLIVTCSMLKKIDQSKRYTEQLRSIKPDAPFLKRMDTLNLSFQEAVEKFKN